MPTAPRNGAYVFAATRLLRSRKSMLKPNMLQSLQYSELYPGDRMTRAFAVPSLLLLCLLACLYAVPARGEALEYGGLKLDLRPPANFVDVTESAAIWSAPPRPRPCRTACCSGCICRRRRSALRRGPPGRTDPPGVGVCRARRRKPVPGQKGPGTDGPFPGRSVYGLCRRAGRNSQGRGGARRLFARGHRGGDLAAAVLPSAPTMPKAAWSCRYSARTRP